MQETRVLCVMQRALFSVSLDERWPSLHPCFLEKPIERRDETIFASDVLEEIVLLREVISTQPTETESRVRASSSSSSSRLFVWHWRSFLIDSSLPPHHLIQRGRLTMDKTTRARSKNLNHHPSDDVHPSVEEMFYFAFECKNKLWC